MITKQEQVTLLSKYDPFIQKCEEYKQLLIDNNLPFTVDIPTIKTALKTQLFNKLLSVDKGLKMRYDLLQCDSARLNMVDTTVDTTGYAIIDDLTNLLTVIKKDYESITIGSGMPLHMFKPFNDFAIELDLTEYINNSVYNYDESQFIIDYFKSLIPVLEDARNTFRSVTHKGHSFNDTLHLIRGMYTSGSKDGEIKVDEHSIHRFISDVKYNKMFKGFDILKK